MVNCRFSQKPSPSQAVPRPRIKKISRSLRSGADGVVSRAEMFRNAFLQHSPQLTTPAAPFNGGFAAFS
jgi:hypothetical protein